MRKCKFFQIVGALTIGANAFLSPPECPLLGKQHSLDDADRVLFFLGVTLQPAFHRIRHNIVSRFLSNNEPNWILVAAREYIGH